MHTTVHTILLSLSLRQIEWGVVPGEDMTDAMMRQQIRKKTTVYSTYYVH